MKEMKRDITIQLDGGRASEQFGRGLHGRAHVRILRCCVGCCCCCRRSPFSSFLFPPPSPLFRPVVVVRLWFPSSLPPSPGYGLLLREFLLDSLAFNAWMPFLIPTAQRSTRSMACY